MYACPLISFVQYHTLHTSLNQPGWWLLTHPLIPAKSCFETETEKERGSAIGSDAVRQNLHYTDAFAREWAFAGVASPYGSPER